MRALTVAIVADPRAAIVAALAGGFFSHWRV